MLVLAAGLGSRFGGMKQVAAVGSCGETILEYNLFDALRAGFEGTVFLIRKDIEADFRSRVLSRLPAGFAYEIAYQDILAEVPPELHARAAAGGRKKPWGTGHALLCAQALLEDEPFAVINGDDRYGPEALAAVADFLRGGKDYCFASYRLDGVLSGAGSVSRAICSLDADSYLQEIREHRDIRLESGRIISRDPEFGEIELSPGSPASMNLWGLRPDVFPDARRGFWEFLADSDLRERGEYYLPTVVRTAMRNSRKRVKALQSGEGYFGLTNAQDLAEAQAEISRLNRAGVYPAPLWKRDAPGREA